MLITQKFHLTHWELCVSGSSHEIIMQNNSIESVGLASQRNLNAIKIQGDLGIYLLFIQLKISANIL